MRYHFTRNANRFDNYRELVAKFDSVGACGHSIKAGEVIGWHRLHGAQCPTCWRRWSEENAEADRIEAGVQPCPW